MAPLRIAAATLALATAEPAAAQTVAQWRPMTAAASLRCGIPTNWIERTMRAESNGRTTLDGRPIRSAAGAIGLMQVMPATWARMRDRLGLGRDPDDPRDNILAGACYLRLMYDRFGYPGLFAAYNAGPARYAAHLATGRALPGETLAYIAKVAGDGTVAVQAARAVTSDGLFALRRDHPALAPSLAPTASLFAVQYDLP